MTTITDNTTPIQQPDIENAGVPSFLLSLQLMITGLKNHTNKTFVLDNTFFSNSEFALECNP